MKKYKLFSVLSIIILMFFVGCEAFEADKKEKEEKELEGGGTTDNNCYQQLSTDGLPTLTWMLEGVKSDYVDYSSNPYYVFSSPWQWGECPAGVSKLHTGWDIKIKSGSIVDKGVYAAYDGKIVSVATASSEHNWGKIVIIEHKDLNGNSFTTNYTHITPIDVSVGTYVVKGQKIGKVYKTDTPHLHFSIRRASYSSIAIKGALPKYRQKEDCKCDGDPMFPEYFIDPGYVSYQNRTAESNVSINIIGAITAVAYPNSVGNNILVQGQDKRITFTIKNITSSSVERSFKLYLNNTIIWEVENLVLNSNASKTYTVQGTVSSAVGNYTLKLVGGYGNLSAISANSLVTCESSGCNPVEIQIISDTQTENKPAISVSPQNADFGEIYTTVCSMPKYFTITNIGMADLTINSVSCSSNKFDIIGLSTPITIAKGQSKEFSVTYTPTSVQTDNGTITISSNASNGAKTISVSGKGLQQQQNTPSISVSTGSLGFGSVYVNQSTTKTFTIQNTGNAMLTVNSVSCPSGFSSNWTSGGTIAAGTSRTVTITFNPTTVKSYSGNITISSNASNGSQSISVSGTGTQQQTGPIFSPSVGQYTSCSGSNLPCGGHTFYAGTIRAGVISSNSSSFTVRVQKCSGSFSNSGTAYVNIGTTCNNAVVTKPYSAGVSYIDITVPLRSGSTTYWITIASATTDYFHAGTISVNN